MKSKGNGIYHHAEIVGGSAEVSYAYPGMCAMYFMSRCHHFDSLQLCVVLAICRVGICAVILSFGHRLVVCKTHLICLALGSQGNWLSYRRPFQLEARRG